MYKLLDTNEGKKKRDTAPQPQHGISTFTGRQRLQPQHQKHAVIEGLTDYFELLLHTQPWITYQNTSANLELKQCDPRSVTEIYSLTHKSTKAFKATLPALMTTKNMYNK